MIDELLRGFGLRTGRYTSPHLTRVTERIVIDGEPVSDRTFVEGYRELAPYIELVDEQFDIPLSFFEIVTALAYSIFADAPVDVAVVEVGMGGTWDNTNVIDAEVAVVTPIGLDHTAVPRRHRRRRSRPRRPGSSSPTRSRSSPRSRPRPRPSCCAAPSRSGPPSPARAWSSASLDRRVAVGGQMLTLQGLGGVYDEVFLPLHGAHQAQNAAVRAGRGRGVLRRRRATAARSTSTSCARAFAAVRSPGRLEPVRSAPTILLDAAHNPAGMTATLAGGGRGVRVPPPGRRRRGAWPTRTSPACSSCSSRPWTRSW